MFSESKKILFKNFKSVIKFEFFFKLLTSIIFIPLFLNIFKLIMKVTGYSYLTLENVFSFLTNPIVAILIILFLLLVGFYSIFDIGTIIILLDVSKQDKKIELRDAVNLSFKKSLNLFKIKNFSLVIYILFLIPFLNLGTGSSVISTIKIPEFISDFIYQNTLLSVIYGIVIIVLGIIAFQRLYAIHYYFLEDKSFKEAKEYSKSLIKNKMISDGVRILLFQFISTILFLIILGIGILLIILFSKLFKWIKIIESILISVVVFFAFILIGIYLILNTTFMYLIISYLFYKNKEEKKESIKHINVRKMEKTITKSKWNNLKYGFAMVSIICLSFFIYGVINDEYNLNIEYVRNMEITAHRGASVMYPENTMSAFVGAKELDADWIELDVQQTKDGKIIVSHDTNFKRITGVDLNSYDAIYDDILKLDAGSFKDSKFKDERIPLLEDVIKWAKDNFIKLNIELKPTGNEVDFEKMVIDIVKDYHFLDDCVLTSQNYEVLENIKNIDSNIKTVYVMSFAFGDILKLDKADHYSVEASSITKKMVSDVHNSGKQIYAWTVNSEESITKMIELNVDNIITDDISLGKKLVLQSKNSDYITEIFNYVYKIL